MQLQSPSLTTNMPISSEPAGTEGTLGARGARSRHRDTRRASRPFPAPRPSAPSRARAHRVGSVVGPERRQCEGRRRAGPSSCPGDAGSGARGRRQRAAAVPCPACGEQRGERGGPVGAAAAPALGRPRRPPCFGQKPLKANHRRGAHTHRSG